MIDGQGLVHLREQHRVATGVVAELPQGIVVQHVDGAALLIDPHRVGAGVAEHPEQLGNVGRERCGLVCRIRDECPAPGGEGSEQQQRGGGLQVEPALPCAQVVLQRAYERRLARACSRCVAVRRAFAAKRDRSWRCLPVAHGLEVEHLHRLVSHRQREDPVPRQVAHHLFRYAQ